MSVANRLHICCARFAFAFLAAFPPGRSLAVLLEAPCLNMFHLWVCVLDVIDVFLVWRDIVCICAMAKSVHVSLH